MDEETITTPAEPEKPEVSTEDLQQMINAGMYDPAIVKSVTCKRKGQRMTWFFTLTDGSKVTV